MSQAILGVHGAEGGPMTRTLACPYCGLVQRLRDSQGHGFAQCCRCRSPLSRSMAKSLAVTLGCCSAILLLLIPTMLEPFLTTNAVGASRSSTMPSSVTALWREGWGSLAIVVSLFILVIPAARIAILTVVLGVLRFSGPRTWVGRLFRYSNSLEPWAMLDIFLLALAIAYGRLRASIPVTMEIGAMLFVGVAILILVVRATLDKAQVWRLISLDRSVDPRTPVAVCGSCGLLSPADAEGRHCARCAAIVQTRHPDSVFKSLAILGAAILLYVPANVYPIATLPVNLKPTAYTVLGGALELADSHLVGLALLVFVASFLIPFLKFIGLSWCINSTLRHSSKRLVLKTRVYRWLAEAGRWSMVDPLAIACFVPVLDYPGALNARAEAAAFPFALVVILTTIAVELFDPRNMWRVGSDSS